MHLSPCKIKDLKNYIHSLKQVYTDVAGVGAVRDLFLNCQWFYLIARSFGCFPRRRGHLAFRCRKKIYHSSLTLTESYSAQCAEGPFHRTIEMTAPGTHGLHHGAKLGKPSARGRYDLVRPSCPCRLLSKQKDVFTLYPSDSG